ncbi:zinc fingers and homeoboxes protein 1 [Aplochiton taeniatus]
MSSRRKSTTPCMVLPSHVLEDQEDMQMTEGSRENEEEEEAVRKDGAGEAAVAPEGFADAVVVVPTPPDTDDDPSLSSNSPIGDNASTVTMDNGCAPPLTPDDGSEDSSATAGAISLSKTPIMKMKSKSDPKRIAVSLKAADETYEGRQLEVEGGGELEPIEAPLGSLTPSEMLHSLQDSMRLGGGSMLVNLPSPGELQKKNHILNPTVLPASLAQVLSALQAQQSAAAAAQPQLLVPLSSIPSYNTAMDSNPLLGNTYKKFPYPSVPEIVSLASQTKFTEEQIKIWFSAQRLKHGVSWTPEEVEEARRKQFNGTVHTVPQTFTVIPAHHLSAAANGLQSILQTCQIVGQSGLVFTQVAPGSNLPVNTPITLTVAGVPGQSQSSKAPSSCHPCPGSSELKRATTVQPPSLTPQENSALSADHFGLRPKKSKEQLAVLKASYLTNHFASDAEIARLMKLTNLTKGEIKKWFSDTRYNQRNSKNSHVIVFHDGGRGGGGGGAIVIDSSDPDTPQSPLPPLPPVKEKESRPKTWNPFPDFTLQKFKEKTPEQLVVLEESYRTGATPSDEELSRLRTETKLTRREIDAWFTEKRKSAMAAYASSDYPAAGGGGGGGGGTDAEGGRGVASPSPSSSSSSRKGSRTPPDGGRPRQPSSGSSRDKTKKSPEQLHMLKRAFVRTQWPATEEYDRLAAESGLPRSYIVNWFGDSRYSWKNGNLKWFFHYQSGNADALGAGGGRSNRKRRVRNRGWGRSRTRKQARRSASRAEADKPPQPTKFKSGRDILKEYYLKHKFLNELDLDELVAKSNMGYEQVREWFAEVHRREDRGSDPFLDDAADEATQGEGGEEAVGGGDREMPGEMAIKEQDTPMMGEEEEEEEEEEEDDEDDEEDSDDNEAWEPSRSVRKSLSGTED